MPTAETQHRPRPDDDYPTDHYYVAYAGVLIAFDSTTRLPVASAHRNGDGWWEGTDIAGEDRMLYPRPDAESVEADIAERLTRP